MKIRLLHFFLILALANIVFPLKAQDTRKTGEILSQLDNLDGEQLFNRFFKEWERLTHEQRSVYLDELAGFVKKADDKTYEAKFLLFKGRNHYGMGQHEKTLENYLASLELYKSLNDYSNIGLLYNELSILTKKQRNFDQAIEYLKLSKKACEVARDTICISTSLDNLGMVYVELDEWEKAEELYLKVLEMREMTGDSIGIGFVLNNLAECEARKGAYEKAVDLINRSTRIREALGHHFWVAVNYNNVGEIYAQFGDHNKAVDYFETSLEKSVPLGYTDLIQHTLNAAANSYTELNNYEKAYSLKEQASVLKDSIFNVNKSRQITEMETKYETERHRLEALAQAERNQRLIAWGSALLAGLLLIGSFIYFRFYQKQKYERKLKQMELHEKVQNERHRISRDLHDNVGSQLTNIITNLDILGFKSEKNGSSELSDRIEKIGEFARNTMAQLRETIWAINKESLTISEFENKVREYLSRQLEEIEIKWSVETGEAVSYDLSPGQALNLFRIVQEATNNMIKHANASYFKIRIDQNDKQLRLQISDDGKGFDPESSKNGHYGLENMKHRAKEIGAQFQIVSSSGEGTKISLDILL